MSAERKKIDRMCSKMKIGQMLTVDDCIFMKAYPYGFPSIYETPEQAFLSSRIGSAWGCWRVQRSVENRSVTISRHEESSKRYYVDPDRKHLFKRMPNGTLGGL